MCENCRTEAERLNAHGETRRTFLKGGAGLAAGAAVAGFTSGAGAQSEAANATEAKTVDGFGVQEAGGPVQRFDVQRRPVGPKDVAIETLYCGICHSDIHTIRGEWGPIRTPMAPGHEIVGRVIGVGSEVTRFKVGDIAGVGCMVDSCRTCENCRADLEQYCLNGATWTYGSQAEAPGGMTQGGWTRGIVVTEHFVVRMPQSGDHAARAPLLCAGVTTFSPLRHWRVEPGMRVGVVGVGGLGHMAVKLAAAEGADVTMFTTTSGKLADAERLGARDAVLSTDEIAATAATVLLSSGAFAQDMDVIKNGSRDGMMGSPDLFTGDAYIEPVFSNREPFVVNAGKVTFLPGARSNWHTHPAGQMLIVTEGAGWVQEEGQEKQVMQPGDVVWCPPGVKHWHGATDTTAVTHFAIQQFEGGENVVWLDPVTDEQYAGGAQ